MSIGWAILSGVTDQGRARDFFVSYSPADERWATWLAWQLEATGYSTLIQAWDFVPGTNFIDFMDRGVRDSSVMLALLSEHYLASRYGTMEWQAAMRTDPGKLIPVRIGECAPEGLLATLTWIDLLGVTDAERARAVLFDRVRQVLAGRNKPAAAPGFPVGRYDDRHFPELERVAAAAAERANRHVPVAEPGFPGAPGGAPRQPGVSVLHIAGPRFGRGLLGDEPGTARDLQSRIWANVTHAVDAGVPAPELLLVSGDLTESGKPKEADEALAFLTGLRVLLGLEPDRIAVVPGNHDVSKAACHAYFLNCEARDRTPQPPYFPKLEQFTRLFGELYQGLEHLVFDVGQPWTLFPIPALRVVVAGLDSTMAATHLPEDDHGLLGEVQAAWFAERLRAFENDGWLRIGLLRHDPLPGPGGDPRDPALLHDVPVLSRLLGNRLNLLLHGPGPGGVLADRLDGVLPVLPAAAPGAAEILHITADGVARYPAGATEPAALVPVEFTGAAAALTAAETTALPAPPAEDPALDPHDRLLARVAEVVEARYPGATVRRVAAVPPHLLVTRDADGVTVQSRVAVHVGEVTGEVVDAVLAHEPGFGSELVYRGAPPPRSLRERAAGYGLRVRSFSEFQGLLDLDDYLTGQAARLRTDHRYPPELYVPQRFRVLDHGDQRVEDDLVAELLRVVAADQGRFVLVLGDFGRGKTFALRELARRITETMPALVPILVELRHLDKTHSVDALVAAHLANHGEDRIDLKALRYMLAEGRVVLLFDGFDELVNRISYEFAADHLETLLRAAEGKAKIVVAARTQHFASRAQVLTALGERVGALRERRIFGIEEFGPAQIQAFLANRYGGDTARAEARMRLLTGIEDLLGLARNPRMLSFIADLDDRRLRAAAGARQAVGAAGLYREILEFWLSYEAERASGGPGAQPGLRLAEMWQAITAFALRVWETGEPYLRRAELTDVARELVELVGPQRLSIPQSAHAIGSGSLLVRTEEDLFGFIHASVAEWLVADHIADRFRGGDRTPPQLAQALLSPLSVDFLCDLTDARSLREWAEVVLAEPDADEVLRTNAIRVTTRLRTSRSADLRGAVLAGEDLSYRDLREVDLTGADLTGARLVGTDLRGAVLRDARLVGARLDEADLTGADLGGADLSRARLTRTDLTGARTDGAHWLRTALLAVTGAPAGLDRLGAAVVPGSGAITEFAPAALGVRHGFHARHGRLPQPIAYSPDGGTIAIGSDDGGVHLYDADTARPLRTLQGHRARTFAVLYAGSLLISGSGDGNVGLWDPGTGESRNILRGHRDWAWPVVAGDGLLATGDAEGVLRVWSLPGGDLRHETEPAGPGELIYTLAVHGSRLAAGYRDGTVRVWDAGTGAELHRFTAASGAVYRLAFDPTGTVLAIGGGRGALALWNPATGLHELAGHTGAVYTLAFHPARPLLASGDTDGVIRLWDTATGALAHTASDHAAALYWVAFDHAGDLLASADSAGVVCVRDADTAVTRHRLTAHTGSVWPFAFRPGGGQLAVTDDQFTTRLWDPGTGHCRHTLAGHGRSIRTVAFNADSSLLAACGNDGSVRLWDPVTGAAGRRLVGSEDRLVTYESAAFVPGRPQTLATVGNDGRLSMLDLGTDLYDRHLGVDAAPIWASAFDPTGALLATANDDDTVVLWRRTTGAQYLVCREHRGRVRSIAFDAAGTLMATGCDDSVVRVWDVHSGELLRSLRGHTDRVYAVAFHGTAVISASWDTTARIWDLGTGALRHELTRHSDRLWTAAADPVTGLLATAGDDLVVRLWDVATGKHLHTLEGHRRRVWSVTFDPAGKLLAGGGDDGTVLLWDLADPGVPRIRAALLGLPEGWAALAPDGRYKVSGDTGGQFWHVVGTTRFETGELDAQLPEIRRLAPDEPF